MIQHNGGLPYHMQYLEMVLSLNWTCEFHSTFFWRWPSLYQPCITKDAMPFFCFDIYKIDWYLLVDYIHGPYVWEIKTWNTCQHFFYFTMVIQNPPNYIYVQESN